MNSVKQMDCSGGTCTATNSGAVSFSEILTPAQIASCSAPSAWIQPQPPFGQARGFYDPNDCFSISQAGYNWPGTGVPPLAPFPSFCCFAQQLYLIQNLPYKNLFSNSGVFYQDPSFDSNSCHLLTDARRDFPNQHQLIACPNSGILDALESFIPQNHTSTDTWGQNLSVAQSLAIVGPIVYDPTALQSGNLYSATRQFCPTLDPGISYTTNFSPSMFPQSWTQLSLTAACCVRESQSTLNGDSGEQCHSSACFTSPQCSEILTAQCSTTAAQRSELCQRWKSVSTAEMQAISVTPNTWPFPTSGSFPSSFDQAMFSLFSACNQPFQVATADPELCASMYLPQQLVFPRIKTLQLSSVFQQFNTSLTVQTLTFGIQNMSGFNIPSLTVLKDDPNNFFTVTFNTQTLGPFATASVTVTTTLTTATALSAPSLVYFTSASSQIVESFNVESDCQSVSLQQMPQAPFCAFGDTELDVTVLQSSPTVSQIAAAFPTGTCNEMWAMHSESGGLSVFPGCTCTSALGCAGGLEGACAPSLVQTADVTSIRSCAVGTTEFMPMFFIDSFSYLTTLTATARQDFPLFGGFVAGMIPNPMNFFVTPSLVVFPLTSALLLN